MQGCEVGYKSCWIPVVLGLLGESERSGHFWVLDLGLGLYFGNWMAWDRGLISLVNTLLKGVFHTYSIIWLRRGYMAAICFVLYVHCTSA
jgi:hypothetical protein